IKPVFAAREFANHCLAPLLCFTSHFGIQSWPSPKIQRRQRVLVPVRPKHKAEVRRLPTSNFIPCVQRKRRRASAVSIDRGPYRGPPSPLRRAAIVAVAIATAASAEMSLWSSSWVSRGASKHWRTPRDNSGLEEWHGVPLAWRPQ